MDKPFILVLENADIKYANLLRRIMMSEIETLAIDQVAFEINNSVFHDEMIAHRLSFVVLNSESLFNKDDEKTNDKNNVRLSLDVSCQEEQGMYVKAGMIVSNNPDICPIHPDTIILKLFKNQRVKLTATIAKGNGREHAKWMPVSTIGYNIFVSPDKTSNEQEKNVILVIETVGNLSVDTILNKARELAGDKNIIRKTVNNFKDVYLTN